MENTARSVEPLADYQRRFAASIRDDQADPPPGVSRDEIARYRDLMRSNVRGFLDVCFPVASAVLGADRWAQMGESFFANHHSSTALFREIPLEFVSWLFDERRVKLVDEPDFLPYLAHYEWLELAASTAPDAEPPAAGWCHCLNCIVQLNPSLQLGCYPYAVHKISAGQQSAPIEPTWLMVWRNRFDEVRFAQLNRRSFDALLDLQSGQRSLGDVAGRLRGDRAAIEKSLLGMAAELARGGVIAGAAGCTAPECACMIKQGL